MPGRAEPARRHRARSGSNERCLDMLERLCSVRNYDPACMRTNVSRSAREMHARMGLPGESVGNDQSPGARDTHATTSSRAGLYRAMTDVIWLDEVVTLDDLFDTPVSDGYFFWSSASTCASTPANCATIPARTRRVDRASSRSSPRRAAVRAGRTFDHSLYAALAADHGQARSPPSAFRPAGVVAIVQARAARRVSCTPAARLR